MAHSSIAEGATGRRAEGLMDRTVESVAPDLALGAGEVDLVRRAQAGDADAFDVLLAGRVTTAYQTAWAILRDEADARDAAQETFFQVWRDLPRLRDPEKFDAWAGRILHNRCMTLLRRRRSSAVREVRVEEWDSAAYSSGRHHLADAHAESDAIRRAFARLTSDQRVLLAFHHVHGRSVADLATITGAPSGTVKWRLHHARQALERALERER
jgi:RNA polymerase sigma-70 factor (ECF subfamily)